SRTNTACSSRRSDVREPAVDERPWGRRRTPAPRECDNRCAGRRALRSGGTTMHGLMMDAPLLITDILRHAKRNHSDGEVVSITGDLPRHRCTYADVSRRAPQLPNTPP